MLTKAQRVCNTQCFFVGRLWDPGDVIADSDVPESGLPKHFGPKDGPVETPAVRTAKGVQGVSAPRPEAVKVKVPEAPEPQTLKEGQTELLGETLLKGEEEPQTIGEASEYV